MTLEDLQAYVGAPRRRAIVYMEHRGEIEITAWQDTLRGERGWWVVLWKPCGEHEIVLSIVWTLGGPHDRNVEIAAALAKHLDPAPFAEEACS